ncbi:MAG: GntR family transcriptional regulator [Betaproteobacteria bacterium]
MIVPDDIPQSRIDGVTLPGVATPVRVPPTAERATLPASVASHLRELITEGELAPGTRLNERALGERLGVSRTPLREALRLLAADGLVTLQPNRAAQVVTLSATDVRESFEVMSGLEAQSGELACRHVSDGDVAEIKALTFEMLACHARRDLPAYYRINHAIHARINRAAGNRLLTEVYERLNRRIQNLRFRSNFDLDKWNRAARDHALMVEALEARDGPRLGALLRAHLIQKGETVLDAVRQGAGDVRD